MRRSLHIMVHSGLRASVEVLRVTLGPIPVHVDNKTVVDGVARGRNWRPPELLQAVDQEVGGVLADRRES